MGKKSKKGVVRTNTKKHNAAGHGKSSTATHNSSGKATMGRNSQLSSCDNSIDSSNQNGIVFQNSLKLPTSNNNNNTVAVTPMPMVHVKEQMPPLPPVQKRLTEADIRNMIMNNIIMEQQQKQRSSMSNDKENKTTTTTTTSGPPSVTVISSKSPSVFTLNLNDGTIDNVAVGVMELSSSPGDDDDGGKQQQPVEVTTSTTNKVDAVKDAPTTILTENDDDDVVISKPCTMPPVVPESIVNVDPPPPAVVATEPSSETQSTTIAPQDDGVVVTIPSESKTISTQVEVSQKNVDSVTTTITTPTVDECVKVPSPTKNKNNVQQSNVDSQQQQQIWSSTLRSIVSTDEDEVFAETPLSKKAVMDVTPSKHSKLVVPIIQTVSPSPDHHVTTSKQRNVNYLSHEEPIPSLDTPDKKDLDPTAKQNLCGCTVM